MTKSIIQVLAAFFACMGFAKIYKVKTKRLFLCGLGAALSWSMVLLFQLFIPYTFVVYLIVSTIASTYAEVVARLTKAPATVFLIPTIFPLVPGGALFYTTMAVVASDSANIEKYGRTTTLVALGIALGIIVVSLSVNTFNEWRRRTRFSAIRR